MIQSTFFDLGDGITREADISEDGIYRYNLIRQWDADLPRANFLMLNPSKADAIDDDPTTKRCVRYARDWDYGSLVITNLFAMRATDPDWLWRGGDPIGDRNDVAILTVARSADLVIAAWGNDGLRRGRADDVCKMLWREGIKLHALAVTGRKQPAHPLMLKADLRPIEYADWNTIPKEPV